MNKLLYIFPLFLLACNTASLRAQDEIALPNILIIYADDLGYGDLSIQNPHSKIPTPNLDRLARQSIRFTDAHSSSGICTPSRYALLTGRYHWRKLYGIVGSFGASVFDAEQLTLPEMLQERGYHTAAMGKWHLGWNWDAVRRPDVKRVQVSVPKEDPWLPKTAWGPEAFDWSQPIPDGPLSHGFDHYFGDDVINYPPYCWIKDDRVVQAPDMMLDIKQWKPVKEGTWESRPGPMISGWDPYQVLPAITKHACEYIKTQAENEQPFFLYFALPSPHAPIIPNDKFDGKSQAGAYGDFVYESDDACGQLLRVLEESGQAENTIVIFSSDNGPERYAYERSEKFDHWSSSPFRGLKRDIYEGGHHVPLIIRYPGVTKPGETSDALVSQIDLMATLAAVVDYNLPNDQAEDSHNLLPVLAGATHKARRAHVHNTKTNRFAIRSSEWVLINADHGYTRGVREEEKRWLKQHGYPADDDQLVELYNLTEDVGQRHNVAADHPEKVAELQRFLTQIRELGHSAPRLERVKPAPG